MAVRKVVKVKRYPGAEPLIELDPWLKPYAAHLQNRFDHYRKFRAVLDEHGGPLGEMTTGHLYFGLNRGECDGKLGVWYREWAPGAKGLSLVGDFNGWDRRRNLLVKDRWGVWSVFLPDEQYAGRLRHGAKIKVHVVGADGKEMFRIPAYIRRVVQEESKAFIGEYWEPPVFKFKHKGPVRNSKFEIRNSKEAQSSNVQNVSLPYGRGSDGRGGLRVYEAHVGMATQEEKVGTFKEFTANVLPRIAKLHYNAVQLMAVQEHPYYGSFGYHVSSFFAVSSRFGTPEDLKELIDTAHGLGLAVIMDLVHSHAVKNVEEGLNRFDGTDHQYFHAGVRGQHVAWDSLVFDYSKFEVQRFLLSNVRYWLEEFRFDGFRFDGVTSMLYLDHGLGKNFTSYDDYFTLNTDGDAVAYLQLANDVAHAVRKGVVVVAEDMSGMPGLARPTKEGGLGFDYRLAMGVPDYWIKTLKEKGDEQWNLNEIYGMLLNRRRHEKHLGYAESHDQALVGDKTLAFWLMDKEMYFSMSKLTPSLVVDRGIALHKMIRLITFALGGEGYLNFMGNEFGHPEWIDFPRQGNNWSYKHARRLWNLVDDPLLKYGGLNAFDRAMQMMDETYNLLEDSFVEQLACHEDTKQLVFRRGPLVFVFNFHVIASYVGLRIPVPDAKDYRVILNTDSECFGGQGRVPEDALYPCQAVPMYGRGQSVQVYLPTRTAQVLAPVK
ncbi:MAG: alpha-amylase family glycosyl hydrolase [Phycisphaerales bacterium]|nr:alpha-amylase family glycosyl hydrolase [Phycisphaerales bacterium]